MKKTIAFTLTLLMLLSVFPLSAAAKTVKSGTCGVIDAETDPDGAAVTWTLDDKGVLTISGKGDMDEYGLRSEGELPTEEEVRSIVVEEGVTAIHGFQFYTAAESVTLPKTITEIPESTFSGFRNLPEIDLPETLTSIGSLAFSECRALEEIIIPNSVTTLGSEIFEYCSALKEVTLPENLTQLPYATFRECSSLETVRFSKNLTQIGPCAFEKCQGLQTIEIPATVTVIGDDAFDGCAALKEVDLPEGLTEIGTSAFHGCGALTEVVIPQSVRTVGASAFGWCENLSRVTILSPETVLEVGNTGFDEMFLKPSDDVYVLVIAPEGSAAEAYVKSLVLSPVVYAPSWFKMGDVNLDGEVTAEDARFALRAAVGLDDTAEGLDFSTPQNRCYIAANVDGEAGISSADARLILRAAVGLEVLA